MRIGVIGSGNFALALSSVLVDNDNEILLYSRDINVNNDINLLHQNSKYNIFNLNSKIKSSNNLKEVLSYSNIILLAVPAKSIYDLLIEINKLIDKKIFIINAIKGLEIKTNKSIQEVIKLLINKDKIKGIVSILGPGFAKNILKKEFTCVCSVSSSLEDAKFVQNLFSNNYFRVYITLDVIGAEYSSSLKNAIAIASGILYGLGYGENSKAALITRGLKEIMRFCKVFGAKEETFNGLTSLGDLVLTANSKESRNFSFGYKIGLIDEVNETLFKQNYTVEGINVIKVIYEISKNKNIDMPIIDTLYEIIFNKIKPSLAIKEIMNRPLKMENE